MGFKKTAQVSVVLVLLVAIAASSFTRTTSLIFEDNFGASLYGIATFLLSVSIIICIDIIRLNPADSLSPWALLDQYFWYKYTHTLGWWTVRSILKCSHNIKKQQEDVLFEILNLNKNTAYGKDNGFDKVKTVEQFQKEIPYGHYEKALPYIDRLREGELSAITNDPLHAVVFTSGTTGKNKFFPMTKHTPLHRFVVCKDYNVKVKTGHSLGRVVMIFHNFVKKTPLKKGQPLTNNLSSFAFPHRIHWLQPAAVLDIVEEPAYLYGTALFSIREREVRGMKTVFSPMMLSFWSSINQNWRQMCKEIEQGYIEKQSMSIDDDVLAHLNTYMKPDPERAEELRREFSKGMKGIARRIWPDVSYVDMVATGSLAPPAQLLSELELKNVPIISTYMASSEVMGGVNTETDVDSNIYTLYVLTYFFEWVPEDHVDEDNPETILTYQLEVGKKYEMVATSYTGIARYRTWDIMKVEKKINQCPVLSFQYRFNQMLSVVGEKLNETIFVQAFLKFCKVAGLPLADFCATENYRLDNYKAYTQEFGDSRVAMPHYAVFIEQQSDTPTFEMNDEVLAKFDKELGLVSEIYQQFRQKRVMGISQLFMVEKGTFQKVKLILIRETQTQQFKMPRAMTKPEPLEFLVSQRLERNTKKEFPSKGDAQTNGISN